MSAGIFITQTGVSVPTAADYQFVFNSNWPSLQVAFDKLTTLNASGTTTLNHNLGFYPLVMGWVIQSSINAGRIFAPSQNFESATTYANYPQAAITVTWDKTNVYLTNLDSANSYQVNIKCYNLDISKSVDYTLPKFPTFKNPYDPGVGIKVTKYGKGITSTDLRDYILHSRAQSPAVLSVVTGNSSTGTGIISYNNPANYIPWTLGFYKDSNGFYNGLAPGTQQSGALFKLGNTITFSSVSVASGAIMASTISDMNLSLVVLRDPLVVAKTVQVQY